MLFLINNLNEKGITESQDKRNFDGAHFIRCAPKGLLTMALGIRHTSLYSVRMGVHRWIDGITSLRLD